MCLFKEIVYFFLRICIVTLKSVCSFIRTYFMLNNFYIFNEKLTVFYKNMHVLKEKHKYLHHHSCYPCFKDNYMIFFKTRSMFLSKNRIIFYMNSHNIGTCTIFYCNMYTYFVREYIYWHIVKE